ncbi:hypothetical protein VNI00_011156 [Paramarasmius palmivorus]|uniref:Uncharacterized protein n=1 Tax=Paramarasmius palmivorus TaxID=297713 RepID=A0AAW0CFU8_9AGAR
MAQESMFSSASGFSISGSTFNTINYGEGHVTNNANFNTDFQVFETSNPLDAERGEANVHRVAYYYGNVYKVVNKGNHNRVYNDDQIDYNYDTREAGPSRARLDTRPLPDPDSEEDDSEDDIDDPSQSLLPQRHTPPGTAINDCYHPLQPSPELHDSEVDPLSLPTSTSLSITPSTSTLQLRSL